MFQLAAALSLLALWLVLCFGMPNRAVQWRETLSDLLTGSQNLEEACWQLGQALAQGEHPSEALGEWCTQVFLPDTLTETVRLPSDTENTG